MLVSWQSCARQSIDVLVLESAGHEVCSHLVIKDNQANDCAASSRKVSLSLWKLAVQTSALHRTYRYLKQHDVRFLWHVERDPRNRLLCA